MAKARKKKRLFIISIIVAALIAACAAVYFGFRTDKITYVGNSHYSNEEMTSRIFGNPWLTAQFSIILLSVISSLIC